MVNKVGAEKYYIIISLILGLMVLGLSLFFIFNEYFTEDELDWQMCRQSIILRTNLPNATLFSLGLDVKDAFPLKCKTEVVTIDSAKKSEEVYGKIAEAVAEGWYMFGEGKFDFVHRDFTEDQTLCLVFARIHYTDSAFKDFRDNNNWRDEFRKNYSSRVDVLIPKDMAAFAFIDYYNSTKFGNTKGTYDEYLSLYVDGDVNSDGNLIVNWSSINFLPEPQGKDFLLVYRINKVKGAISGPVGLWLASFVPSGLSKYYWTDENIVSWQGLKTVALASPDDLESLKCDKFLTIPA